MDKIILNRIDLIRSQNFGYLKIAVFSVGNNEVAFELNRGHLSAVFYEKDIDSDKVITLSNFDPQTLQMVRQVFDEMS